MYHVDIDNKGAYLFEAKSKDGSLRIDIKGNGMTPPDVLLASLGSCIGVYCRKYAESAGLPLGEFSVSLSAELSKEAPVSFRQISVTLDLKGAALDERRKKALLDFVHNCPVDNTLHANPAVTVTLV